MELTDEELEAVHEILCEEYYCGREGGHAASSALIKLYDEMRRRKLL